MMSGPNQPTGPSGQGGRGRRRRRGRRPHGAGNPNPGQPQQQNSGQSSAPPQQKHRGPEHRQQRRPGRPQKQSQNQRVNQRVPDAGIYSAPMDHSYRSNQDANGNQRQGRPGFYQGQGTEAVPETNGSSKAIYAFVDDLFFLAKIQETARKLNVKVDCVKPDKEVLDKIVSDEQKPGLIIFDLNSSSSKPLTIIPKLKSKLKKATSIIGFLSHLQGELKVKALEAGCDMVLPRSAFSQNLPQLLRRHAATESPEDEGL